MQPITSSSIQNQVTATIQKQPPDIITPEEQNENAILNDIVIISTNPTSVEDPFKPKTPSTAVSHAEKKALYKSFANKKSFSVMA
ncbi:MAG: hypothetical protein M0T70_04450 [Geobacteraceae bacterium]|nr:hypothetical protein [Geobacteraceae bacterium]